MILIHKEEISNNLYSEGKYIKLLLFIILHSCTRVSDMIKEYVICGLKRKIAKIFIFIKITLKNSTFFYCEWVGGDELGCWNVDENF